MGVILGRETFSDQAAEIGVILGFENQFVVRQLITWSEGVLRHLLPRPCTSDVGRTMNH